MFKFLFLVLAFTSVNEAKSYHNYRSEFKFVTHWYNSSNCSNNSFRNMTIESHCNNNDIINGHPRCCYEFLNNINVFKTHDFNNCIDTNSNSIHPVSISYNCFLKTSNKMTFTEVVTIIGLIGLLVISSCTIGLCVLLICRCSGRESQGYNQI